MAGITPNSPIDRMLNVATQRAERPSGMLENHPDLTPVSKARIYTDDYLTRTELEGAINASVVKIAQEAATDGKMNVVAMESDLQNGIVDVVNYEATDTAEFQQGDSETVEGVLNITLPFVDDNPADDAQQVTLNDSVGSMLANVPGLEVAKVGYFYADDFDSRAELQAAVNRAALEVGQHAETDGYKNIVTVEANIQDGTIGVVSYRAEDTSDFTQGEELDLNGYLHVQVAYIDQVSEDDSGKFTLNLPPMRQ